MKTKEEISMIYNIYKLDHILFDEEENDQIIKVQGTAKEVFRRYSKNITKLFELLDQALKEENYKGCQLLKECVKMEEDQITVLLLTQRPDLFKTNLVDVIKSLPAKLYDVVLKNNNKL